MKEHYLNCFADTAKSQFKMPHLVTRCMESPHSSGATTAWKKKNLKIHPALFHSKPPNKL